MALCLYSEHDNEETGKVLPNIILNERFQGPQMLSKLIKAGNRYD